MIRQEEIFFPLLEADPSFQPRWEEFVEYWKGEPGDLPQYLLLSDLARHLIGKLKTGDTAKFDAVFDVVERWHLEGADYVEQAATIGLLEDLQNKNLHDGTEPEAFLAWLRPLSRGQWTKVEAFWNGGPKITVCVRPDPGP